MFEATSLTLSPDFSFNPDALDELSSAQLALLASGLHSTATDPLLLLEARNTLTERRETEAAILGMGMCTEWWESSDGG